MAIRLPDGSIQMADGRILYANSVILAQDLLELMPLFTPPPAWPFVSGGGGGGAGPQGPAGPAGSGGGGAGTQGSQGFQGTNPGPAGPQGNQGVAGAGVQGPQGNQGAAGTNGAQGPQGDTGTDGADGAQGFQGLAGAGAQGFQGNDGAQGFQGDAGSAGAAGAQGFQGFQGDSSGDVVAATFVVDPTGNRADFTDIQSAVDAAAAVGGGLILVHEGTYPISAPIAMPDADIVIRGSGNGTIIDLGANAIFAFEIPNVMTAQRDFVVEDLFIQGNGLVANGGFQFRDVDSLGRFHVTRVKTEGIRFITDFFAGLTASDGNFIYYNECWFRLNTDGTTQLANYGGPGSFFTSTVYFQRSWFMRDNAIDGVFGLLNEVNNTRVDFLIYGSVLMLQGQTDCGVIMASNSVIHGPDNADPQALIQSFGSFNDYFISQITGCGVRSMSFEFFTVGGSCVGNRFDNCEVLGIADQFYMGFNNHTSDFGTIASQQATIDSGSVVHSRFAPPADPGVAWGLWTDNSKVVGCVFAPAGGGEAALRVSQDNYIAGNTFEGASGVSIPAVREVFGENNVYEWNENFDPDGAASPSVFTDVGNVYDGIYAAPFNGTATAVLQTILQYRNRNCIVPETGVFRNTGGVSVTITENWTPVVGAPASRVTVVPAGTDFLLLPGTPPGGTNPPFTVYTVQAQTGGGSSAYTIRMALAGGKLV